MFFFFKAAASSSESGGVFDHLGVLEKVVFLSLLRCGSQWCSPVYISPPSGLAMGSGKKVQDKLFFFFWQHWGLNAEPHIY
jgi:hypothetical protein